IEALQSNFPLSLQIYFAGKSQELMQAWLGENFTYYEQQGDDLGKRMLSAFAVAFAQGMIRVVLIGTDCPDLNPEILLKAFQLLQRSAVVLGPAADGGYYLIGLSHFVPELFSNISWGTPEVLFETRHRIENLNLQVSYLPMLHDVDVPEDLVGLIIN
ncbi:MAG: TIGR04282 family arsenosugar biosynthesis glycosyltransferase, partial [Microcystis aeruginosa]